MACGSGQPDTHTNVTAANTELKGAQNGIVHRETSFSAVAFDAAYRSITGEKPIRTDIATEGAVVLNGKITGLGLNSTDPTSGSFSNNLPLPG